MLQCNLNPSKKKKKKDSNAFLFPQFYIIEMKWVKIYRVMLSNVYCLFVLNFIDSDKAPIWIDLSSGEIQPENCKYSNKVFRIH